MLVNIILVAVLILFGSVLYIHNRIRTRYKESFYFIHNSYDDLQNSFVYLHDHAKLVKKSIKEASKKQEIDNEYFIVLDRLHKITSLIDNIAYGVNNGIISRKAYNHIREWIKEIYDGCHEYISIMRYKYGLDTFEDISKLIHKDFKEDLEQ